ncbi:hypothetical protein [uncultured Methylobacterium sp.]|uniref:hypothetical protein n=1 Tax=uncultured Methylobacterium sp. TaxID=157278 RepID=UPI0035CC7BBD
MLPLRLGRELGASVVEHGRIVDAIRAGDAALALEHAHRHRIRARDARLPRLESFGLKHL